MQGRHCVRSLGGTEHFNAAARRALAQEGSPLGIRLPSQGPRDIPDLLNEPKVRQVGLGGVLLGYGIAGFLGDIVARWPAAACAVRWWP